MISLRRYLSIALIVVFAVSANACRRNEQGEGAAEQAGKTIDKALERAGEETGRVLERARVWRQGERCSAGQAPGRRAVSSSAQPDSPNG